jgi:hypothetical protein
MNSNETKAGRPLQRVSWSEKVKDDKEWFKRNARHYLSLANFGDKDAKNWDDLYQVYNNDFPAGWFTHVTDPLSAKEATHKKFPGKIRPVTMLRTNIDLLYNEYPKRPFVYQVVNMGEDGYNAFLENLNKTLEDNLTQHFVAAFQEQAIQQGLPVDQIPGLDEIESPESVKEKHGTSYKDKLAIRGQKWLKRALSEYGIRNKFKMMFKDWLITGQARSYKGMEHGELVYERIPVKNLRYDKSETVTDIEDGEWAVCMRMVTESDVVDHFYDELKEKDYENIESRNHFISPMAFMNHLQSTYTDSRNVGKIPVYHIVWKGKKKKLLLSYPDPLSGEMQSMEVDEDYIVNKDLGETTEVIYGNEVYETWMIGEDIFVRMGAIPVQRNEMANTSACKLPYNGRAWSDTHAVSISPMEIGIPFQIMYMIINRSIEMTIAKSKGKFIIIDKNVVPKGEGWNEEKFLYYADALGWAFIKRDQIGVDKSFNQYQTVDLSMMDQLKQLIDLQEHYKTQWDDALGINRQRKGASFASDGKGVSEMNMMQSSVITDGIFTIFEEFIQKELQGLLDYSRFLEAAGSTRSIYNQEDYTSALMDIDPVAYASASLGVMLSSSVDEKNALDQMKAISQAMVQNKVKPSTILEVQKAVNVAELQENLRKIEDLEVQMEQQMQLSEQEAQEAADERAKRFAEFENMLNMATIDKEWDRKDQNTLLQQEYDNAKNVPEGSDPVDHEKIVIEKQRLLMEAQQERERLRHEERMQARDLAQKERERLSKEKIATDKNSTDIKKARYSKKSSNK